MFYKHFDRSKTFLTMVGASVSGSVGSGHSTGIQYRLEFLWKAVQTHCPRVILSSERGHHRATSDRSFKWFLLEPFLSLQKRWGHETRNQPQRSQWVQCLHHFKMEGHTETIGWQKWTWSYTSWSWFTARTDQPCASLSNTQFPVHMPRFRAFKCSTGVTDSI